MLTIASAFDAAARTGDVNMPLSENKSSERLTRLRQILTKRFNEEELRTLCFDLRVDELARRDAEQANEIARKIGNNYVLAEALLDLYLLNSYEGRIAQESGDRETAMRYFGLAKQCFSEGAEIAYRFGYDLLISVYEQFAGGVAFDEDNWGRAFEHYVAALEHGARFGYARLHRSLDSCTDRLIQLPTDLIRYYADYVVYEWKTRGLDAEFPDVVNMFELIKEYREYVSPT
jgi:hypothetical protein